MAAPIRFLSGRQQQQKIGIEGSTDNQKVLEVVGQVGIGTTVFEPSVQLEVRGDASVSGVLTTGSLNVTGDGGVPASLTVETLNATGVSTFGGAVDINAGLDVDGQSDLDELVVAGVATFSNAVDINSTLDVDGDTQLDDLNVAGVSTFSSAVNATDIIKGYKYTAVPYGSTVTLAVTVASKDSTHRYNGTGSGNGYVIDGIQAPFLTLTPGRTYRFTNDNTGSHPLKFYLEADKTTLYETNVNFQDAYTEITVTDQTPIVLHYQCTAHGFMGNAVQTNANVVNTNYPATIRSTLDVSGVSTFTQLDVSTGGIDVDGQTNLDELVVAGVSTFTGNIVADTAEFAGNVTVGGTLFSENKTNIDSVGLVTARTGVRIITGGIDVSAGFSTFNDFVSINDGLGVVGGLTADSLTISGVTTGINAAGISSFVRIDVDGQADLDEVIIAGVATFQGAVNFDVNSEINIGTGVTILGNNLHVTGIVSAAQFIGDGSGITNLPGISTLGSSNLTDVNVSGTTTTAQLRISGIGTAEKFFVSTGGLEVDGQSDLDELVVAGVSTFSANTFINADLSVTGDIGASGIITATGINLVAGSGLDVGAVGVLTALSVDVSTGGIDVDGQATLDEVVVAGVATFSALADVNNRLDVAGGANIDQLNVAGIASFTQLDVSTGGIDVDGQATLDEVVVSGASTFTGTVKIDGALDISTAGVDIDGLTNLDELIVAGVSTFSSDISIADKITHTGDTNTALRFPAADTFTVETGGNERLRITSAGNVGIDSTVPSEKLDVAGNIKSTGTINNLTVGRGAGNQATNTALGFQALNANTTGTANVANGYQSLLNNDDGINNAGFGYGSLKSNTSGDYNIGLGIFAVQGNETGNNNVGLGAHALQNVVSGSNNVAIGYFAGRYLTGSNNTILGAYQGTASETSISDTVIISAGTAERLRITSTGLVGIGITNPTSKLDVVGDAKVTGVVTATTFVGNLTGTASNASGATGDFSIADKIVHTGDTNTAIRFPAADTFTVETAGSERLRITSAGNVNFLGSLVNVNATGVSSFVQLDVSTGGLDVDGQTDLDELQVAGVSTFSAKAVFNTAYPSIDADNEIQVGTAIQLGKAGVITATSFSGDGSALTGIAATDHVSTFDLVVAGVSTFHDDVRILAGGLNVTGVVTATSFSGSGANLTALNGSNISSGTVAAARVATLNQDTTGTASFINVTANNGNNETVYPVFVDGSTGSQGGETDTALSYNPSTDTFTAGTFSGAHSGNGAGLTALDASELTSGVVPAARMSGTYNIESATFTVTANNSANETVYPVFVDGATGSQGGETDTGLNYNPSTGALTAVSFSGSGANLTGIGTQGPDGSFLGLVVAGVSTFNDLINTKDIIMEDVSPELRFVDSDDAQNYRIRLNSGLLGIRDITNNVDKLVFNTSGMVATGVATFSSTSHIKVPAGSTGQRPGSPTAGDLRYNSDDGAFEGYTDSWGAIGGGTPEVDTNVSSTSAVGVGSFATASFRSAEVVAQIVQIDEYQVGKYLMIHDGTTVTVIEQAAVSTGDSMIGSFDGAINGSNAELRVTMVSSGIATVTTKISTVTV